MAGNQDLVTKATQQGLLLLGFSNNHNQPPTMGATAMAVANTGLSAVFPPHQSRRTHKPRHRRPVTISSSGFYFLNLRWFSL